MPVVVGESFQQRDRVAVRRPVAEADDREPANGLVVVRVDEAVERRANGVDRAGRVAGQELERDQRRAAARGALVVEPAGDQLRLLAEPELADRAIGDRPLAVVGAPRRALDLVLPLAAQIGQLALVPFLGESVGLGRCLGESQAAPPPFSERGCGPT